MGEGREGPRTEKFSSSLRWKCCDKSDKVMTSRGHNLVKIWFFLSCLTPIQSRRVLFSKQSLASASQTSRSWNGPSHLKFDKKQTSETWHISRIRNSVFNFNIDWRLSGGGPDQLAGILSWGLWYQFLMRLEKWDVGRDICLPHLAGKDRGDILTRDKLARERILCWALIFNLERNRPGAWCY